VTVGDFVGSASKFRPAEAVWMEYWTRELKKVIAEDYSGPKAPIPLEVVRAHICGEADCP